MIRPTLAVLTAVVLGGCSLAALDGFSEGAKVADGGGTADSSQVDGGTSTDAGGGQDAPSTGEDGAAENGALSYDGFEATATCAPWVASRSTASTTTTTAQAGSNSCNVCMTTTNGGGIERAIRPKAPETVMAPGEYTFTVWVRSA